MNSVTFCIIFAVSYKIYHTQSVQAYQIYHQFLQRVRYILGACNSIVMMCHLSFGSFKAAWLQLECGGGFSTDINSEEVSISLLSLEFCCVFWLLMHRTGGLPLAQPGAKTMEITLQKPSFLLPSCYLNCLLSHQVSLAISLLVSLLLIFLVRIGEGEWLLLLVRDMKGLVPNFQLSILLLLSADFDLGQVEHGQSAHRDLSVLLCSALHIPSLF